MNRLDGFELVVDAAADELAEDVEAKVVVFVAVTLFPKVDVTDSCELVGALPELIVVLLT